MAKNYLITALKRNGENEHFERKTLRLTEGDVTTIVNDYFATYWGENTQPVDGRRAWKNPTGESEIEIHNIESVTDEEYVVLQEYLQDITREAVGVLAYWIIRSDDGEKVGLCATEEEAEDEATRYSEEYDEEYEVAPMNETTVSADAWWVSPNYENVPDTVAVEPSPQSLV